MFDDCLLFDVICILGGIGINELLFDVEMIVFVQQCVVIVCYVMLVCMGLLLFGVVGLLCGWCVMMYWVFYVLFELFGVIFVCECVVCDGNLVMGGGVMVGIDFVLMIVVELVGEEEVQVIQL